MQRDLTDLSETGLALAQRLVLLGLEGASQEALLEVYCREVAAAGIPLLRVHVAQRAYHPEFGSFGFDWLRDGGLDRATYAHTSQPPEQWLRSPLYHLLAQEGAEMAIDLRDETERGRFPILADIHAQGGTGYFAIKVSFSSDNRTFVTDPDNPGEGMLMSWSVEGPDGLTEAHKQIFREVTPFLAIGLKSCANRQMASDIVSTYLGADAGERVLSGDIVRGSTQSIDAVIWYFDLEGFTQLSEQQAGEDVIELLNAYFEVVVAIVEGSGGNVLKFMGDGLLAIFEGTNQARAVDHAVASALKLEEALEALRAQREAHGLPVTDHTLALHRGEVLYGNIGGTARLDFTVIGAAVNTTARILGMCGPLQQRLILSAEVAGQVTEHKEQLVSLGRYMLRGVARPRELFTLYMGD